MRQVHEICQFCENCSECEKLTEIRERLNDAYFFKKITDAPYQPMLWKKILFTFNDNIHFSLEIIEVEKIMVIVSNFFKLCIYCNFLG